MCIHERSVIQVWLKCIKKHVRYLKKHCWRLPEYWDPQSILGELAMYAKAVPKQKFTFQNLNCLKQGLINITCVIKTHNSVSHKAKKKQQ